MSFVTITHLSARTLRTADQWARDTQRDNPDAPETAADYFPHCLAETLEDQDTECSAYAGRPGGERAGVRRRLADPRRTGAIRRGHAAGVGAGRPGGRVLRFNARLCSAAGEPVATVVWVNVPTLTMFLGYRFTGEGHHQRALAFAQAGDPGGPRRGPRGAAGPGPRGWAPAPSGGAMGRR